MDKSCTVCGLAKPLDQFPGKGSGRHGVAARCKPCQSAYRKAYYYRHHEASKAKSRAYHDANREAVNAKLAAANRARYAGDPEYRAQRIASGRESIQRAQRLVFAHYGGDPPRCACCGETEPAFLTLDHTNGGGGEHRKQAGSKGPGVFYWLIKNGFPDGYAVLCWNCHMAKDRRGGCPHAR